MLNIKRTSIIRIVLYTLAIVCVLVPIGCASKNTNNSANVPAFSKADSQILTSAYADYDSLKQNSSPDTARQELVKKLNTENGVANAYLGADGTSIFFNYDDGFLGIVDTFDPNENTKPTTSSLPNDGPTGILDVNATKLNLSLNNAGVIKNVVYISNNGATGFQPPVSLTDGQVTQNAPTVIPESKKILILQPISPGEKAYTPIVSELPALFTANGWNDTDIDLKRNTDEITIVGGYPYSSYAGDGSGLLIVKPEDYYDLSQYGVVLFLGHAATGAEVGDPQQYYLEFANVTSQRFRVDTQLRTWAINKQIVVGFLARSVNADPTDDSTNIYRLFIRSDLLQEKMGKLPQSYVQLASCYGAGFSNTFLDGGAAEFMSWDSEVDSTAADNNEKNVVKRMLAGMSASEAYKDMSVIKSDKKFGADFLESMNPVSNYYLPAWVNLTVNLLPVETSSLKVDIWDLGKNRYITENKALKAGQTSMKINDFGGNYFPPGSCEFSIYALDSKGSTLRANYAYFALHAGANDLTISISNFEYALSGSQDPMASINFSRSGGIWLYIKLNGQYLVNGVWSGVLDFNAQPGDELEIMVVGNSGETFSPDVFSASLGPLWFTSWLTGEQVQLTDAMNFKQFFGYGDTVVFDKKFTIPGSKPSTTQTSTSTTTTTTSITSTTVTPTTEKPTTSSTTETPTTTFTITTTQTSTPLTQVNVWLTTTNDSNATHVSTLKTGAVTTLYIWAQGGNGQTGDFNLSGTLQNGTQMQLGTTKHATPGNVMYCGQWNGGFLNTVGSVTVNATSGGTAVGSTSINITN
jgi:hypothetical protein